jgi:CRISPR-associated protein Csc3
VNFDVEDEELHIGDDEEDIEEISESDVLEPEPLKAEVLTLQLLQGAIRAQNPDDRCMSDFAEYVLPNLLRVTVGATAKGGAFFDNLDAQGKTVRRDNAADQSLATHLLNGLFPANLIEKRLEQMDTTIRRCVGEQERRLALAAFVLHDFEKFPDVPDKARDLPLDIQRSIVAEKIVQLGLDRFIDPENSDTWRTYLDDLLAIAFNAQRRWNTNWNFGVGGLRPVLPSRTLRQLTELTCLADSLASIVKHPWDAGHSKFKELLFELCNGQVVFTYHAITENRGVLTNILNNALIDAHPAPHYTPLLYLPTGVIYLATKDAPPIDAANLPQQVVDRIKRLCAGELRRRQTGFGRDGKGMKFAEYYTLFFDDAGLMSVALAAVQRIMDPAKSKKPVSGARSANLKRFQAQKVLPANFDFDFGDDTRIDQLAEFCDLVSRKIWGERRNKILDACKKDKSLPIPEDVDLVAETCKDWELEDCLPALKAIGRINESLRELKIKGNTGGVPYEWYYLAAQYLKRHPGIENVGFVCEGVIARTSVRLQPILERYTLPDGWDDLREWVKNTVVLPAEQQERQPPQDVFLDELKRYQAAKKAGRGRQMICSISHSAYTVSEQMESAVLFTPQVYTNKQMLGGSNAKRNISSIAATEMMLRQILMSNTGAVGKRFEDGKYRYLYLYPTYYFTPETNRFLQKAYRAIAQTRFTFGLRNHFIRKNFTADFARSNYQAVDAFLLDPELERSKDRTFKLSYPDDQPLTFYFMALPPGRDPTDTESWVMPAWLALTFPLILDVKAVASESPIPPFLDGSEFEETVFLDGAPQAIRSIVRADRFRLNHLLDGKVSDNTPRQPPALTALTAAYAMHLDVFARPPDPKWNRLPELAQALETSPLYVFNFLNKWARDQGVDAPSVSRIRLYTYYFYPCFDPEVSYAPDPEEFTVPTTSPLNRPKTLTELYRRFYRTEKRYNASSRAVLRPLDEAASVIMTADPALADEELVALVAGGVGKLMDRVRASTAEGRWVIRDRDQERLAILEFARYFVEEVFVHTFASDRARLDGRQLNLLRDACEFLYRLEEDREQATKPESPDEPASPDASTPAA